MTMVHRLLKTAQRVGIPLGRWPEEGSKILHLRRLMTFLSIDLVLDVGAHHGEFGQELRRDVRYDGDMISFEPAATSAEALRQVAGKDDRWTVEQVALGDRTGSAELHTYPLSQLNSLRTPTAFGRETWRMHGSTVEAVTTARLDELSIELQSRTGILLKVDTQGHDLAVLAGAEKTLAHVQALQIEVPVIPLYEGTPLLEETLGVVKGMGFALSGLFPVAHDPELRVVEFDLVAVRSSPRAHGGS